MLEIKNPHSVLAALKMRPEDVFCVQFEDANALKGYWQEVSDFSKKMKVEHKTFYPQQVFENKTKNKGPLGKDFKKNNGNNLLYSGRGGKTCAFIKEKEPKNIDDLFSASEEREKPNRVWLALDQLQDPQNLGAIFRIAAFFGVSGIVLTQERSAPISSTVYDVSSGGVEYVPFSLQVNMRDSLGVAKKAGLWILGASEHAEESYLDIPRDRSWLIVLGNEEKGIRPLVKKTCDMLCGIPPVDPGGVTSLNVASAAAVLISRFCKWRL